MVAAVPEPLAVPDAPAGADVDPKAIRRASRPLRRLLARWAGISHTSTSDLHESQSELQEVIEQSETAVLQISRSFRNITSRSTQQINHAMGLLQTTRGPGEVGSGDQAGEEMSLPEYIRAYEVLLNFSLDRLHDFAGDCLKLVANTESAENVAEPVRLLTERLRRLAHDNQGDVEQLRADSGHLSGGMVMKNQQVIDVLKQINTTAQEIRRDVNELVMAMQFQDITQQRLERLRGPLLGEIIRSLNSITDETRVLSRQLKAGELPLPDAKQPGAKGEAQDAAEESVEDTPTENKRDIPRAPDKNDGQSSSVELF